jgi:hypothetical protein
MSSTDTETRAAKKSGTSRDTEDLADQIDFGIGAESTTASPGTLVHLPAGPARRWKPPMIR